MYTYQFYNYDTKQAGRPFGCCFEHLETQQIPPNCSIKKLSKEDAAHFWGTMIPSCDKCRIENSYKGKENRNG